MKKLASYLILIAWLVFAGFGWADEYAVNCLTTTKSFGANTAWKLPPSSTFMKLNELTLLNNTSGDVVVSALLSFPNNGSADTRVSYRILVDGVKYGPSFILRSPTSNSHSQVIRAVAPDLAAGTHKVVLEARNLGIPSSGNPDPSVAINVVGVFAQVSNIEESTVSQLTSSEISVGSSWTTVQSVQLAVASNKMIELGGFFRITSGTPGNNLEYRFVDGTTQLALFEGVVPAVLADSVSLAFYHREASAGTRTLQMQVRRVSGSATVKLRDRYLFVQTMPRYHLWDGESTSVNLTKDGQDHLIAESPPGLLTATEVGTHSKAFVSGFSFVTLSPETSATETIRFDQRMFKEDPIGSGTFVAVGLDNGKFNANPLSSQAITTAGQGGGCKNCAWNIQRQFKSVILARSLCESSGGTVPIKRARVQLIFIPNHDVDLAGLACKRPEELDLAPATTFFPNCP